MLFDHLSFVWQVWGYGLLGAILFMAILFVIAEWSAIVALFAVAPCDQIDPPSADDRACAARADARERLLHRGLSEIMRGPKVIDMADRRKQLDAIVSCRRTY